MHLAAIFSLVSHSLSLPKTLQIHGLAITSGWACEPSLATKLVRLYAVNGNLCFARLVFDQTTIKNVFLWNSIIRAFAIAHQFTHAFSLYSLMRRSETKPDSYTLACVLRACCDNHDVEMARMAHTHVVVSGFGHDLITGSALVSGYAKLGWIDWAQKVFHEMPERDVVLWNALISGYGTDGCCEKALELFNRMRNFSVNPDGFTFVALVSSLCRESLKRIGEGVHALAIKNGFGSNSHVNSGLVTMYSRCNRMDCAYRVFVNSSNPDLVTWSSLVSGYAQSGDLSTALVLFRKINFAIEKLDPVLVSCVLPACTDINYGKEIHGYVIRHGFQLKTTVRCSLVHMYSRCGFPTLARRVFDAVSKNTFVYNAMISGFAINGHGYEAIALFMEMNDQGFFPDHSTFSGILCACSHCGLLDEGLKFFREMEDFGIRPNLEHYLYVVKLLGMAGKLEEAYALIHTMPMEPDSGVWGALLSACRFHGNTKMGEYAAHQLFKLEPTRTAYRVMLSNLYATSGRWNDVMILRGEITDSGMKKIPAFSCIAGSA